MKTSIQFFALIVAMLFCHMAEAKRFTTVVIDPGHGGRDKGAYWGGVRESYLNMIVASKLVYELKARKIPAVLTRRSDRYISFNYRVSLANRYRNSVFVSVHFNASTNTSAKGIETYYTSSEGRKLALCVQRRLVRSLKGRDRGVRKGNFKVIRDTRATAILVECGFISNKRERGRCATRWYQSTAARVIADGLVAYRRLG